jgi:hypothetical protein
MNAHCSCNSVPEFLSGLCLRYSHSRSGPHTTVTSADMWRKLPTSADNCRHLQCKSQSMRLLACKKVLVWPAFAMFGIRAKPRRTVKYADICRHLEYELAASDWRHASSARGQMSADVGIRIGCGSVCGQRLRDDWAVTYVRSGSPSRAGITRRRPLARLLVRRAVSFQQRGGQLPKYSIQFAAGPGRATFDPLHANLPAPTLIRALQRKPPSDPACGASQKAGCSLDSGPVLYYSTNC